jgi:RNA polymerase sigma-70 factor (ECF subfamily)
MRYTPEDFETIYRATVTQVSKHVFFKVQNLQDAQDLVQDVYYDLYKHMTSCTEKIENPQAYLIQMANNQLTTYYRDKLRRPVTIIDDEIDLIESIPDDFELETEVLDKVTSEALWDEIHTLSDLDQQLMVSRYKYEMSFIDMAKQFNLPETTIKSKVYKSLETLKKKFNK